MNSYSKNNFSIKQWAEEDRPREKLMLKGKVALSDAELIAILIGSGNDEMSAVELSRLMLNTVNNDLGELSKLSVDEFKKFRGIGEAKALSIISALELGRRRKATDPHKKEKINSSKDLYDLMKPHLMDLIHEEFWIVLLNRANQVLKKKVISTGGISGTIADPKLIFKTALENLASAVILVHNHPSGNKNPSDADLVLTRKIKDAGKLLEIPVLDHLIYTENDYYSFADEGRIL
ncbi:MAG TPA: DNA repair protein RadC [Cytophagaceae bacterium]|jgi:DNA repair protein RadC|nr:DNA repair protein RadC [Cytophagaceae bacterium]